MNDIEDQMPKQLTIEHNQKVENRRIEVWDLLMQGFTQQQIADKLDVSLKTISRDIKEIKKESVQWMESLPKGEIQMQYRSINETLGRIIQELWKMYDNNEDNKLKITILNSIAQKRKQLADIMNPKLMLEIRSKIYDEIRQPYLFEDTMHRQKPRIDYETL